VPCREREPLQRAVRDDDAGRIDSVLLGDQLLEWRVAAGRPVLKGGRAVALERLASAIAERRDRKEIRAGHSPRERDQRHGLESNEAGGGGRSARSSARADDLGDEAGDLRRVRPDPDAARPRAASFFACAVPAVPEMIAPACPIVFPGGAVKPRCRRRPASTSRIG
jgi:hypothetical protein